MKFTLVAALSMATAAMAAGRCLQQADATELMEKWVAMMSGNTTAYNMTPTQLGVSIMEPTYFETSDSVMSLMQNASHPLGAKVTTAGRTANLADLIANPVADIQTLEVFVGGCHKVVWYWVMPYLVGPKSQEVKGINIFDINLKTRQIKNSKFEFNSIAWGTNTRQLPTALCPLQFTDKNTT